jgi:hypothetical protein
MSAIRDTWRRGRRFAPLVTFPNPGPRERLVLQVRAKTLHEGRNPFGITMRSIGKFIESDPRGSGGDAVITRVEVLMEVVTAEADDRDMNTLCPLGPQAEGDGSRCTGHRFSLGDAEISQMIDVSPRHNHAVAEVGLGIRFERRQMEGDGMLVAPKETAREFDLARDFAADQAGGAHDARLALGDIPERWPRRRARSLPLAVARRRAPGMPPVDSGVGPR